jgi:hypothetical protein
LKERCDAFNSFLGILGKSTVQFEVFNLYSGGLRQAIDSLYVYIEHELQQARLGSALNDVRKSISDMKANATRQIADYQRELLTSEKEVINAEKKLNRTKEQLDRLNHLKKK